MKRHLRLQQLESRLAPAIATWDGGGANNLWTTDANWAGDVAPNPGDDLVFPLGAAQPSVVNDFAAGTAFNSIETNGTNYVLNGNTVALAAGFRIQGSLANLLTIGLSFTLTADQTFTGFGYDLIGNIDLNGRALRFDVGGATLITGAISGAGSVTFAGGNTETRAVHTYTGPTFVINGGSLGVEGAIPGPITLTTDPAQFGPSGLQGIGTVGNLTVNNNCFVSPGRLFFVANEVGTLTTGNLTMSGTASGASFFTFEAGASDRFDVRGTVQVAGQLTVGALGNSPVPQGTPFTLIANDGTDAIVGTFVNAPEGGVVSSGSISYRISYRGGDGNDMVATAVPFPSFAVGAGPGALPAVNVYDSFGSLLRTFNAYDPAFRGGVRVATAEVNGDGAPDIITVPGAGGGPVVRVWHGITGAMIREFNAYDPAFRGGVFLAIADLNADGFEEIITGAGAGGGPHVKSFDSSTFMVRDSFFAYDPSFLGGVSVAAINGRFLLHGGIIPGVIVTGAGPGGGPHVKSFRASGSNPFTSFEVGGFFAYDANFRGGVNVAASGIANSASDVNGLSVVTAPASGGGPDVRIFALTGERTGGFFAYSPNFFGGVTLAIHPVVQFGPDVIITGAGPGGGPHVRTFSTTGAAQLSVIAFDPAFTGGVFVG